MSSRGRHCRKYLFYNSSLGPFSFPDGPSVETIIAINCRTTSFTALTHSIAPSLQACIQSAIRCRVISTNLVAGEALGRTGDGDGRDS
jgi:hypothetical protein